MHVQTLTNWIVADYPGFPDPTNFPKLFHYGKLSAAGKVAVGKQEVEFQISCLCEFLDFWQLGLENPLERAI